MPRLEITWVRGWDLLKDFRFGQKRSDHKFCPECGSSMVIDPCYSYKNSEAFKDAPDAIGLNVGLKVKLTCIGADIMIRSVCLKMWI